MVVGKVNKYVFVGDFIVPERNIERRLDNNDNLDTEYYLFCWLNATRKDFTKDDIRWLEYALVRKKDLIQYLESENLTREHILENRDWILNNVKEKGAIGKDKHKDLYFYYSPQLAERPVNIIVKKDVYLKLAILHGEIKNC